MSTGVEESPQGPAAAPEKPNPFQRIAGVLFAPAETFQSIARKPDILVPLLILLIIAGVCGALIANHIDFAAPAREAMESRGGNLPPEQMERAVRMSAAIGKVATYASPLFSLIGLAVLSGVLLLAFRLFGGEGDYKQAFSVATYASYVSLIESILRTIVLMTRKSISPEALPTILRSNLAFLVDFKTQPMAFALLSSLDIFTIWLVALLIIGFAAVSRLSKEKSAAIVISLWAVVIVIKLGFFALRAARMGS